MDSQTIATMRLEIGNVANALRVLRTRVGGHQLNEAETVAKLAEIEKRVEPLEAALWAADVLGGPNLPTGQAGISDRPSRSARKKRSGSLVYLASPYSDPDPAVRQARFEAACQAASALIRNGDLVFSPVVHSHALTAHGLPACDFRFWERLLRAIMRACTGVTILMVPGWRNSFGVYAALVMACELHLPIQYIYPTELQKKGARQRSDSVGVFN